MPARTLPSELQRVLTHFADMLLLERGLSQHTVAAYSSDLRLFLFWWVSSESRQGTIGQAALASVSRSDIMAFLAVRVQDGASARSAARMLSSLRRFFGWLVRERLVDNNPSLLIDAPSLGRPLPITLSETEVQRLLDAPDVSDILGLRDRAMLEMLYACGLRVSELVGLQVDQVQRQQGVVRIWGKGNKERIVPMGEQSGDWLVRYEREARPDLLKGPSDSLFLSRRGRALTRQTFWHRIKLHGKSAGIKAALSPHTLRHAFATHLVNHDADLRVVQLLLGHSDLSTTQIYTHVARERMKSLHQTHHPRG